MSMSINSQMARQEEREKERATVTDRKTFTCSKDHQAGVEVIWGPPYFEAPPSL